MKKLFSLLFLLLILPLSFTLASDNFSNPDDSSLFGDTWTNGTSETISWYSTISPAKLLLFRNTGSGNSLIKSIKNPLPAGVKNYTWNPVNVNTPGSGYKVAICPTAATSPNYTGCAYSDSFTIDGETTDSTQTSNLGLSISVSPTTITAGGSATLAWNCTTDPNRAGSACDCRGSWTSNPASPIVSRYSQTVTPTQTTTYTLSCRDKALGNIPFTTKSATLKIGTASDLPKMILKANGTEQDVTVKTGTPVNLSWGLDKPHNFSFAGCRRDSQPKDPAWDVITNTNGIVPSGSKTVSPTTTTNYQVSCYDNLDNYADSRKVNVETETAGETETPSANLDTDGDGVLDKDDKCLGTKGSASTFGCPARTYGYICDRANPLRPVCRVKVGYGDATRIACSANCSVITDPNVPITPNIPTVPTETRTTDGDNDGVPDRTDRCPNSAPDVAVGRDGCTTILTPGYSCNKTDPQKPVCEINYRNRTSKTACERDCVPAAASCVEIPFTQIATSLLAGSYTKISEDSFKSWAQKDDKDYCAATYLNCTRPITADYPAQGSGDERDIKGIMTMAQLGQTNLAPGTTFDEQSILDIKKITDGNIPAYLSLGAFDANNKMLWAHAVIALSVKLEVDVNGYKHYIVEVLDPNGPKILNLDCNKTPTTFACVSLYNDEKVYMRTALQSADRSLFYSQARNSICSQANYRGTPFCTRNISQYLRNSYPEITNFVTNLSEGQCYGWTQMTLAVAYLGDFTGECHPGGIAKANIPPPKANFWALIFSQASQLASTIFPFISR